MMGVPPAVPPDVLFRCADEAVADLFDDAPGAGVGSFALNVLWLVLAGIWIFLSHLVLGVGLALTIIGIPFAWQHLKFGMLALAPFGKQLQR